MRATLTRPRLADTLPGPAGDPPPPLPRENPVTSSRLRECLAALHWTQRGLAVVLDMDDREVRRWAAGAPIPDAVAAWREALTAAHLAHPAPLRWRSGEAAPR